MRAVILLCVVLVSAVSGLFLSDHLFDGLIQELEKIEVRIHGQDTVITQDKCVEDCKENLPVSHLCGHLCVEAAKKYTNIAQ